MTAQTILPANTLSSGYDVANSARFDDGSSAYMHFTPGSGNRRTFTISMWVKRAKLGEAYLWGINNGTNPYTQIVFDANDKLYINDYDGGEDTQLITTQTFKDIAAWYHIVIAYDTTQSTASNRIKLYVNGTRVTAFATETYCAQNFDTEWNNGVQQDLGKFSTSYGDYYLAEVCMVEDSQLTPTSFGEFDEDSPTVWKPIDVSGLTFNTEGFYLDFEDSGNLGDDESGNENDFTEVNFAATDQSTDTCTNNFCTCNPLDQTNTGGSSATMAEGNLKWTSAGNATSQSYMRATFGLTAGKWYWEAKMSAANSGPGFQIGVAGTDANMNAGSSGSMNDSDPNTQFVNAASSASSTRKDGSNVTTSLTTVAEDQIVQIALDLDNQKFYIGVQGTYLNSADPAAGSNAPATVDANTTYLPAWCDNGYADQITLELNFGNPTFSISSGNTDGNGYGNFEYAPPSGFLALCTKNLGSDGG